MRDQMRATERARPNGRDRTRAADRGRQIENDANVVVDIRKLTYSNAAGWKCFVYWMKKMQADERATYRMCILCEETLGWQQVGMSALRIFGGERLQIKVFHGDKRVR